MMQPLLSGNDTRIVLPSSIDVAVEELARCGARGRIVAGCTDLTLALRRHDEWPEVFVVVGNLTGLCDIHEGIESLEVGAAVRMTELVCSPVVRRHYAALADAARYVGGVQIRNVATVGGNVCNASPGADTPPALLVLNAVAEIAGVGGGRQVPLEKFFVGPRRTILEQEEMLVSFRMAAATERSGSAYFRLTARNALDLAIVGVAAAATLESDGATIAGCRIALGAVASTPLLVPEASNFLVGKVPNAEDLAETGRLALQACKPIDDVRASAAYRREIVPVLVRRAIAEALNRAGAKP